MKGRSVLVTGGLGYLGGRLCQALVSDPGMHVVATTRRTDPSATDVSDGVSIRTLDLLGDEGALSEICRGIDALVHLAAPNEIDSAADPDNAVFVNGLGTRRLLAAAARQGVRRFVYLSTAHVYGAPLVGRITEETVPRPTHPYAIAHHVAEDFVLAARDNGDMSGVVLRLSNGIGAPASVDIDRWTLIGNDLCRQAVETGRLVLRSTGLQWRDFVPLRDAVSAIRHVLDLPDEALEDGLFNLGSNIPLRMIDLAERVAGRAATVLGKRPDIQRPTPGPGESHETIDYRIDKLLATGFRPSGDLDGEIDATLEFCDRHFGEALARQIP